MACTLGNKCAKNCCKQTILVLLLVEDVVICFMRYVHFRSNFSKKSNKVESYTFDGDTYVMSVLI